jgi:hypothetical protein
MDATRGSQVVRLKRLGLHARALQICSKRLAVELYSPFFAE